MRYVFVRYNPSPEYSTPENWLKRTALYTGIQERLALENEVINIKQINYKGIYLHNGVEHHFVHFGNGRTFFPLRLNRYVAKLQPDIVIVQGLNNPAQTIQLALLLPFKTKLIVQHHAEKPFTGWKTLVQKAADRFVQIYLFASEQLGQEWVDKGIIRSPAKVHEVMEVSSALYPIPKDKAKRETGVCGTPVFIWVGRLNANKDPLTVINAFLRYIDVNISARLYMFFHTDELRDEIEQLLTAKNACDKVILKGKIENAELLYWFNSADFYLSGSHYEGSGTAVCEAMSCRCIPIVTDIPSFRMITNNGECGWLYPAGDEDVLFNILLKTKSPGLQEKQTRALSYFNSNLSFEAIAREIQLISLSVMPT